MFSLLQVLQVCSRGAQLIAPAPPSSMLKMVALKSAIAARWETAPYETGVVNLFNLSEYLAPLMSSLAAS